jgi:hypothetical protein
MSLQINNSTITEKDLREFKETPIGRFVIQYLEAKAETVIRTPMKIITEDRYIPDYDIDTDRQIYKNLSDIIRALSNPEFMQGEIMRAREMLK